jgi:GH18 family chitinase
MYEEFIKIKKKNQQIKALLSLGGASAGVDKFKRLAESKDDRYTILYWPVSKMFYFKTNYPRKHFIKNAISILRKYNFDGLDLGRLWRPSVSVVTLC